MHTVNDPGQMRSNGARIDDVRNRALAALAFSAVGLATALVAFMAMTEAGPAMAIAALAVYAAIAVAVARTVGAGHPYPQFGMANGVTLFRGVLNCLLIGMVWDHAAGVPAGDEPLGWAFFGIALVSLLLDGLDGALARRSGMSSRFGARFDIETDALLLVALALGVVVAGKAGPWVLMISGLYYLFRAAGVLRPWLLAPLPPAFRRKLVFVAQAATLLFAMAPPVAATIAAPLLAVTLALLLWSFGRDCQWLWRHAR